MRQMPPTCAHTGRHKHKHGKRHTHTLPSSPPLSLLSAPPHPLFNPSPPSAILSSLPTPGAPTCRALSARLWRQRGIVVNVRLFALRLRRTGRTQPLLQILCQRGGLLDPGPARIALALALALVSAAAVVRARGCTCGADAVVRHEVCAAATRPRVCPARVGADAVGGARLAGGGRRGAQARVVEVVVIVVVVDGEVDLALHELCIRRVRAVDGLLEGADPLVALLRRRNTEDAVVRWHAQQIDPQLSARALFFGGVCAWVSEGVIE